MIEAVQLTSALMGRECLLFAATIFCVLGAEDLAFDLIWIGHHLSKRMKRRDVPNAPVKPSVACRFAILVPAWDEGPVIASMIANAIRAYKHSEFTIFVGTYPNDAATRSALAAMPSDRLMVGLNRQDGPTSKGDALNTAWLGLLNHERATGEQFDLIVLHDAEDVIHSAEPDVFADHAGQHDFMQIPVVPIPLRSSRWISGHYCDEFAEAHLKSLVVRDSLKASIPSAGVGTAIGRGLLVRIAEARGGSPFSPDSLTEDYELGLIAASLGASSRFLRIDEPDTRHVVAVRSRFPDRMATAVRQKSRWIAGIAFAGWDRLGWSGRPLEVWMRWRDRRTPFEASALVAGYGGMIVSIPAAALDWQRYIGQFGTSGYLLFWFASALMLWRLAIRATCTRQVYGWRQALMSIPRVVISNSIAVLATIRAARVYWTMRRSGRLVWDKTQHNFAIGDAA